MVLLVRIIGAKFPVFGFAPKNPVGLGGGVGGRGGGKPSSIISTFPAAVLSAFPLLHLSKKDFRAATLPCPDSSFNMAPPDILRWSPGVPNRGLPHEWTWEGNSKLRALFSKEHVKQLIHSQTSGVLFRFAISPLGIEMRDNSHFVIWLEKQRIQDRLDEIEGQERRDQEKWREEYTGLGAVEVDSSMRRIVLTNLSSEDRTIVLRSRDRKNFEHQTESYHTIRGLSSEVICFCSDILAENNLSLVINEISAGRYDNKDIGHSLIKITTKGHSRVHVLLIDTNEAGKRTPPRLWDFCVAGLQGQTFRNKTGLKDILPPDGPKALPAFRNLPSILQTSDIALSDLNNVNGKVVVPRDYFGERMNLGPMMLQINHQYEPHLCCRHNVGIYTKINIDETIDDQDIKITDDRLQRLRDYGIRTSPRISLDRYDDYTYGDSEEGDDSEDSDSDLEPLYSSNHPGNVIVTIQDPRTRS